MTAAVNRQGRVFTQMNFALYTNPQQPIRRANIAISAVIMDPKSAGKTISEEGCGAGTTLALREAIFSDIDLINSTSSV